MSRIHEQINELAAVGHPGDCVTLAAHRGRASASAMVTLVASCLIGLSGCGGGGADNPCSTKSCPDDQRCEPSTGACVDVCPPGLSFCDGVCADTSSNAANCGGCGNACPSGNVCVSQQCMAITQSCPLGYLDCGGVCINPLTDRAFCGAADCQSATPCADGFVCNGAGVCELSCQAGLVDCGGTCVDPKTNRAFCGADAACLGFTTCAAGEICNGAGACELSCQAGLVDCGGTCVDPNTDRTFCGADAACQEFTTCAAGEICNGAGACELSCQAGLVDCGGTCVNPQTDRTFCGADAACQGAVACGPDDQCDQGACTPLATPRLTPVHLVTGSAFTCILLDTGGVRCWGAGDVGQHGYGFTQAIGDNDVPTLLGDVNIGGKVVQISSGSSHTCVVLDTGNVRCWGNGGNGRLGYGNTNNIGDNEVPAVAGDVDVGGKVVQVAAGGFHTCALLDTGNVRCWGFGGEGALGYGNSSSIGDNEPPASAGDVNVGGPVVQIVAGNEYTCALLTTGAVRCWGLSNVGQLGYGNTNTIGDNEKPASAGDVIVGGIVVALAAHFDHTCALLSNGNVHCWGAGGNGRLGYGNTSNIGDDDAPGLAGPVNVGGTVVQVSPGGGHTCAVLASGKVRCWGAGQDGRLGYGNTASIGDNEPGGAAGDVDVAGPGHTVLEVSAGGSHTCALIDDGHVRCWGLATTGQLGYGNINSIGDNELPSAAGDVPL